MSPTVSVVMANYNGEGHLGDALRSVLAQSMADIEVLLVDDASTDGSMRVAEAIRAVDSRLRIERLTANEGPAAARNRAIEKARGQWIAVVDSDDFIHPDRLRRLVATGEADGADIVADDMLIFDSDYSTPPARLLGGALAVAPTWVSPIQYVRANRLFARAPSLGYLKPLIRTSFLRKHGVAYAEGLRIAEDYDLVLRLLARGARFRLLPEMLYFYRRHAGSVSHRLSPATLQAMCVAEARFRLWAGPDVLAPLRAALDARIASIHIAGAVEAAIAGLKARQPLTVLGVLAAQPRALPIVARLAAPRRLLKRLGRRLRAKQRVSIPRAQRPVICVLSRQRLIAGSNGSSSYLLSLCRTLRDSGFSLRLISPSPAALGRVPMLRMSGLNEVFDDVAIRGTWRIGGFVIARNPLVFARAAIGVAHRLATRVGVTALGRFARPAPYAVGLPWAAEDFLFVAAKARGQADVVFADYGFLTPGIPYALSPSSTSAVLMHDLISSRSDAFAALGAKDSMAALDEAAEADLLAQAGVVIAIQQDDAAAARRLLQPGHPVLVAPMAVEPVAVPQPGEGRGLLFVGSSTAPNVDGMDWFLTNVWPRIRHAAPGAALTIVGTVCNALGEATRQPGVTLCGRVADLAPLYREADIVISPLRVGSGLKIKLVEALAHGKPVVATSVTAQGVGHLLQGAVAVADTAEAFAAEVLVLLAEPGTREARAAQALAVARESFSANVTYADVVDHLRNRHALTADQLACAA